MGLISRVSSRTYRWGFWPIIIENENGKNLGANLMRKMGWSDGQGLGKNNQGMTRNIQAKVKNNNYGIGCSVKDGKDWVAGQDDFNAVLRMLNDDDTSAFKQEKRKQKRAIQ